jgi:hypothetical protein
MRRPDDQRHSSSSHFVGAMPVENNLETEARRAWVQPTLHPHSTLTVVTQATSPAPLTLLFLQASVSQCFDGSGNPIPCP